MIEFDNAVNEIKTLERQKAIIESKLSDLEAKKNKVDEFLKEKKINPDLLESMCKKIENEISQELEKLRALNAN